MAASLVCVARLIQAEISGARATRDQSTWLRLTLGLLLLLSVTEQYAIVAMWDGITDGLTSVVLLIPLVITVIATAILLLWLSATKYKRASAIFVALTIVALASALHTGLVVSAQGLTASRAETIDRALQQYFARNGRYPDSLAALAPWYLLNIPEPIMFRELTWCYTGGEDYYRLGYVYRDGAGAPASVRIHAESGTPPERNWMCEEDAVQMNARYCSNCGSSSYESSDRILD